MSQLAQYLAAILLERARQRSDEAYSGSPQRISTQLVEQVGPNAKHEDVQAALSILEPFGAAEVDFSPLTGGFWTINFDNFRYYFIENDPDTGDYAESYKNTRALVARYPVLEAYARRGLSYAEDAAEHLKSLDWMDWEPLRQIDGSEAPLVPASDRLVTLQDNSRGELDDASSKLISAVERENGIHGSSDLRQAVIGQLKAGRELVRVGVFKAHLLHVTWITLLNGLVERYKGQAIGEAAKKLLDLLIEHVFKS